MKIHNIRQLEIKQYIDTINKFNKRYYNHTIKLPSKKTELNQYIKGIKFISFFLWKLYLILNLPNISKKEKIYLIKQIPDPNGNTFVKDDTLKKIYKYKKTLNILFNNYLQTGGRTKHLSTKKVIEQIQIPSLTVNNDLMEIPISLFNMTLSSMSTISQLISSSINKVILPPPMGWVPNTISNFFQGIHILTNGFTIFTSIIHSDWDNVIQNSIGIIPQFLIISNGLSIQLISINRFLKTIIKLQQKIINGDVNIENLTNMTFGSIWNPLNNAIFSKKDYYGLIN